MEGSSLMETEEAVPLFMRALGVKELSNWSIEIPGQARTSSGVYCMCDPKTCQYQGEPIERQMVQPGTGVNYTALRHQCLSENECTKGCVLPKPE